MKSPVFSYKFLIAGFIVILLVSWFIFLKTKDAWTGKQTITKNQVQSLENMDDYLNNPENNKDPDFAVAKKSLEDGDIKGAIPLWEKVVKKEEVRSTTNTGITLSKPKINSKIILAQTYLQYWNYYYKEKEYADKAIKIITENQEDDDYGAYGMYFVGYAYEITKRYDDALTWYEKGLKVSSNTDKLKAIFKNQIGHVYDLMGDMNKAYEYYSQAYVLDDKNYHVAGNIGRHLARIGSFEESVPYFEYAIHTHDLALRSEIYYTLSSIELELGWLRPDIDKSLLYARASIKSFPDYPMGYVALARWLYMKNDRKYDKEIEENLTKSIELNPNGFAAYKYSALYMFDKWDMNAVSVLMSKSNEVLDKDIILMHNISENEKRINTRDMQTMIILDKINKEWKGNKELIDKILTNDYFKWFIDLQKKRVNNGVLNVYLK
ncbi:MAG: hypothetical protein ACD_78C00350G0003 [uncultured bacterium (gcode 4)]|uniref:Uncharacterized protein n=1 Tax=uncultured bacterium (gcode 4) TaxID=1234023 RepID=K1XXC0_9BACT|nr:MAG: hypothetical protein ACD_78C00350G0003 [uncultured bacterium (gcode 4)]